MITVEQAKELGVVFVGGDVSNGTTFNKDIAHSVNSTKLINLCQVTSFAGRKHTGGEMPCGGDLPVVVKLHLGSTQTGRNASCFNWLIEGVAGDITSWKPDLEALEKLVNEKKGKTMPQKQYTYELVTDLDTNGIAKAMIDGEVFYGKDGCYIYKWNGDGFVNNRGNHILLNYKFYRKVEKQIDWRKEVCNYVNSLPDTHGTKLTLVNNNVLKFKANILSEKEFLEMCRVALRATGELN